MSTCADAILEVKRLSARNEDLLTEYNNKRDEYDRQINAISVPSNNRGDYSAPEAGEHYACDGARHDRHRSECSGKSHDGHPSGSYEWTGEEWTTWGGGPCRKTNAKCYIKQDYINGLHNSAQNKRNELINLKNGVKQTSLPVPDIGCCQTMQFQGLSADKIQFNNVNQSCQAPPPAPAPAPAPGLPAALTASGKNGIDKSKKVGLVFIGAIVCIIVLLLLFFLLDDDSGPTAKST